MNYLSVDRTEINKTSLHIRNNPAEISFYCRQYFSYTELFLRYFCTALFMIVSARK